VGRCYSAFTSNWGGPLKYRVVQKTGNQFYFWDNFGNSAPILTIFSLLQAEIYGRKREVFPPTKPLLCDHLT